MRFSRIITRAREGDAGRQAAVVPDPRRQRSHEGGHRERPAGLRGAAGAPRFAPRALARDGSTAGQEGMISYDVMILLAALCENIKVFFRFCSLFFFTPGIF